jgi:NitT/TauT family transport system substrate-binding protein
MVNIGKKILLSCIICFMVSAGYSADKVKAGYYKVMPGLIYFVAKEKGFFKAEGIELIELEFQTSNQLSEAVALEKVDVGMGPALFPILGIESNEPGRIKIFATLDESSRPELIISKLVVPVDSDINKIIDLKGKTIGVFPGIATSTHLKCALRDFLEPADYQTVQIPPPLQMQALETGQVDALFVLEPIPAQSVLKGVGRVIEDGLLGRYIFEPMVGGVYVFSSAFLQKNPAQAKKVQNAVYKAIDWIRDNEKEARKILAAYLPISEEVALRSSRNKLDKVSLQKDKQKIQKMIDFYYQEGVLSKKIDAANLLVDWQN